MANNDFNAGKAAFKPGKTPSKSAKLEDWIKWGKKSLDSFQSVPSIMFGIGALVALMNSVGSNVPSVIRRKIFHASLAYLTAKVQSPAMRMGIHTVGASVARLIIDGQGDKARKEAERITPQNLKLSERRFANLSKKQNRALQVLRQVMDAEMHQDTLAVMRDGRNWETAFLNAAIVTPGIMKMLPEYTLSKYNEFTKLMTEIDSLYGRVHSLSDEDFLNEYDSLMEENRRLNGRVYREHLVNFSRIQIETGPRTARNIVSLPEYFKGWIEEGVDNLSNPIQRRYVLLTGKNLVKGAAKRVKPGVHLGLGVILTAPVLVVAIAFGALLIAMASVTGHHVSDWVIAIAIPLAVGVVMSLILHWQVSDTAAAGGAILPAGTLVAGIASLYLFSAPVSLTLMATIAGVIAILWSGFLINWVDGLTGALTTKALAGAMKVWSLLPTTLIQQLVGDGAPNAFRQALENRQEQSRQNVREGLGPVSRAGTVLTMVVSGMGSFTALVAYLQVIGTLDRVAFQVSGFMFANTILFSIDAYRKSFHAYDKPLSEIGSESDKGTHRASRFAVQAGLALLTLSVVLAFIAGVRAWGVWYAMAWHVQLVSLAGLFGGSLWLLGLTLSRSSNIRLWASAATMATGSLLLFWMGWQTDPWDVKSLTEMVYFLVMD